MILKKAVNRGRDEKPYKPNCEGVAALHHISGTEGNSNDKGTNSLCLR